MKFVVASEGWFCKKTLWKIFQLRDGADVMIGPLQVMGWQAGISVAFKDQFPSVLHVSSILLFLKYKV
jgi:hypothetical protein